MLNSPQFPFLITQLKVPTVKKFHKRKMSVKVLGWPPFSEKFGAKKWNNEDEHLAENNVPLLLEQTDLQRFLHVKTNPMSQWMKYQIQMKKVMG